MRLHDEIASERSLKTTLSLAHAKVIRIFCVEAEAAPSVRPSRAVAGIYPPAGMRQALGNPENIGMLPLGPDAAASIPSGSPE